MTQRRVEEILAILIFVSFPLAISRAQEPSNTGAASVAIKQVMADWVDAFNRHNAHASAMLYSQDADLTNMRQVNIHGRTKIEQFLQNRYATRLKNAHRTAMVRSIRLLTPAIAAVDCDWEMTGAKGDDGSDSPPRKGYLVLTMTQQNGHWLITVFHEPEYGLAAPTK